MRWYEDPDIIFYSKKSDNALDNEIVEELIEISNQTQLLAEEINDYSMKAAYFYYISFTSLSNYINKNIEVIDIKDQELLIEKSLYLCRICIIYMDKYSKDYSLEEYEKIIFDDLYLKTKVNYCNLLIFTGRYISAIFQMRQLAKLNFGMAIGNLGLELYDYAILDYTSNQECLFESSYQLLKLSLECSDHDVHQSTKSVYKNRINTLERECLINEKCINMSLNDILKEEEFKNLELCEEKEYWNWVTKEGLSLNTLNDIYYSYSNRYDSIHLPTIICPIDQYYSQLHGLFNQIKQEYCSARYILFDGMFKSRFHFSDNNVKLYNTLDYPKYGLSIEKVKSAYRSAYALFDRIGFFLNKYYDLKLSDKEVSFRRVWKKDSKIFKYMENNHALKGLYWIKKDLYSDTINIQKENIDPILHKTYNIRNIMEHRYLKILDSNFINEANDSKYDEVAHVITSDEFYDLGINLIRTCREMIILLCLSININEKLKVQELDGKIIGPMYLDDFDDEWKF